MTDGQSDPRRRARKAALLDAARRRFAQDGFAGTSVASIVREAGVAQGTFYLYFENKAHLLVHLRAEILRDFSAALDRAIARDAPADARLVQALENLYAAVRRHRKMLRVIRQATSGDEIDRVWVEGRRVLAGPLGRLLAEGQAEGRFDLDAPPSFSAHLLLSLFDDLLFDALEYRVPAGGRATLRGATRFVLRGLGVARPRIDDLCPSTARAA